MACKPQLLYCALRVEVCLKMPEVKERIFGYDALKALAAFFVVLYHVRMVDFGYREGVYYLPTFTQVIWLFCACGVPLFFMVNGALTVRKQYDARKSFTKAGRLVLAGIVWGVIAQLLLAIRHHAMPSLAISSLTYYWFLFSLALLYVVNYLLSRMPQWCRWMVVGLLVISPFLTNLVLDIILLVDPGTHLLRWRHGAFTLYGLVYLYLGDYLAHHNSKKWIAVIGVIIGLALLALEATAVVNHTHAQFETGNFCFPTVGALLLSAALFVMVKDLNPAMNWLRRVVLFLGNNALGIYIFHLLIMIVLGGLFPIIREITVHPMVAILIAMAYTIVAAAISEAIRHTPLAFLLKL